MPPSRRLVNLEKALVLQYEKLSHEKNLLLTVDPAQKSRIKQQIQRLVLETRQYEAEYWELLAQEVRDDLVEETEAIHAISEVVQEVEVIQSQANYPTELIQLLTEIRDILNQPTSSATAKLKLALPLIPGIISYEVEMDKEKFLREVVEPIKSLFKRAINADIITNRSYNFFSDSIALGSFHSHRMSAFKATKDVTNQDIMSKVDAYLIHEFRALEKELEYEVAEGRANNINTILLPMLVRVSDPSWDSSNTPDYQEIYRIGDIVACQGSSLTVEALQKDPSVVSVEASRPGEDWDCRSSELNENTENISSSMSQCLSFIKADRVQKSK